MSKPNVLVVDDDPSMLRTICRLLRCRDIFPTTAVGVVEAESAIQRENFDVILTDIDMGDDTGFELVERLRPPVPRVIFMSGHVTSSRKCRAQELGGVLYDKFELASIVLEVASVVAPEVEVAK